MKRIPLRCGGVHRPPRADASVVERKHLLDHGESAIRERHRFAVQKGSADHTNVAMNPVTHDKLSSSNRNTQVGRNTFVIKIWSRSADLTAAWRRIWALQPARMLAAMTHRRRAARRRWRDAIRRPDPQVAGAARRRARVSTVARQRHRRRIRPGRSSSPAPSSLHDRRRRRRHARSTTRDGTRVRRARCSSGSPPRRHSAASSSSSAWPISRSSRRRRGGPSPLRRSDAHRSSSPRTTGCAGRTRCGCTDRCGRTCPPRATRALGPDAPSPRLGP